jgi:hypothetical protein
LKLSESAGVCDCEPEADEHAQLIFDSLVRIFGLDGQPCLLEKKGTIF